MIGDDFWRDIRLMHTQYNVFYIYLERERKRVTTHKPIWLHNLNLWMVSIKSKPAIPFITCHRDYRTNDLIVIFMSFLDIDLYVRAV